MKKPLIKRIKKIGYVPKEGYLYKKWIVANPKEVLKIFVNENGYCVKRAVRTATGRIEIQQAGEYNVVQFAGAAYGNHALTTQIRIEYTLDNGQTWLVADTIITLDSPTLETYRVYLPEGVKRIAIVVVENSGTTVNLDSIKLMK